MSTGSGGRRLAIAASLVAVAAVAAAIAVMESPSIQRKARLDGRRVRDLRHIVNAVDAYVKREKSLPADLTTLAGQPGLRLSIVDSVDGSPYTYEVSGDRTFRLCAVFATDTAKITNEQWFGDDWNHGVGRQCFDRTAEDEAGQK